LKRVALRDDVPALALRASRWRSSGDLVRAKACGARIAYSKVLALEPNPAGRRWLERKTAPLVTP